MQRPQGRHKEDGHFLRELSAKARALLTAFVRDVHIILDRQLALSELLKKSCLAKKTHNAIARQASDNFANFQNYFKPQAHCSDEVINGNCPKLLLSADFVWLSLVIDTASPFIKQRERERERRGGGGGGQ